MKLLSLSGIVYFMSLLAVGLSANEGDLADQAKENANFFCRNTVKYNLDLCIMHDMIADSLYVQKTLPLRDKKTREKIQTLLERNCHHVIKGFFEVIHKGRSSIPPELSSFPKCTKILEDINNFFTGRAPASPAFIELMRPKNENATSPYNDRAARS